MHQHHRRQAEIFYMKHFIAVPHLTAVRCERWIMRTGTTGDDCCVTVFMCTCRKPCICFCINMLKYGKNKKKTRRSDNKTIEKSRRDTDHNDPVAMASRSVHRCDVRTMIINHLGYMVYTICAQIYSIYGTLCLRRAFLEQDSLPQDALEIKTWHWPTIFRTQ